MKFKIKEPSKSYEIESSTLMTAKRFATKRIKDKRVPLEIANTNGDSLSFREDGEWLDM